MISSTGAEGVHIEVHAFFARRRHCVKPSSRNRIMRKFSIYFFEHGSHSASGYFSKMMRICSHLVSIASADKPPISHSSGEYRIQAD